MSLVRRVLAGTLAPALLETTFSQRGFPDASGEAVPGLEAIPQAVVCGFEWALESRDLWELERRLALVDDERRGFAYEGATMGCVVLDTMTPVGPSRAVELIQGPARPYTLLSLIGVGFALSRLPRATWSRAVPDLTGNPYWPLATWLVVDGYAFDLAYFDADLMINRQRRPEPWAWEGDRDYFLRACDQGIGRALWFIDAGRTDAVAASVRRFAPARRADLWSGVGLAATFAGGSTPEGLAALREAAGEHAAHLAQGSAFAARAAVDAGVVPEYAEQAARALAGTSVPALAELVADAMTAARAAGPVLGYEATRETVRSRLRGRW